MDARDQVIAAAEERARAMAQQDRERLLKLLHEEFRWTSHAGEVFDRDEYVRRNVAGAVTWRSQELTDTTVTIVGDAAVLWAVATDVVESDGQAQTFRMPMTQAWVRDREVWRCLAGHAGPRRA